MAYRAVQPMSNQWGHFDAGQVVPRGRIPNNIYQSWIDDEVIVQEEFTDEELEEMTDEERDAVNEADEDEQLHDDDGQLDPTQDENPDVDPSLNQAPSKPKKPDFGGNVRPARKKNPTVKPKTVPQS